jgi:hypothetical protein
MTNTKEEFEQNDMRILFSTKDSIDFTKKISFKDEGKEINKIIIIPGSNSRKVLITDEVKYQIQKYLFNIKTNQFVILNKDYKNPVKKKIKSMDDKNSLVRRCLLHMTENQMTFFFMDKSIESNYNNIIKELKEDKERQFKKEKKEEAKDKKFEELKEGIVKDDQEKKNIEEEKFDFEKNYEFDNFIYYRILLIDVNHQLPKEPNKVNEFKKYLNEILDEIRHFMKKNDFNSTESYCNNGINKIISMKKILKEKWNEKKNEKNKKECMEILKKILLNKALCLDKKNTIESLDKAIETANLYFDLYKEDIDDQYMKMSGRLVNFKMKKKEWDDAKKHIDKILNYYKNKEIPDWVNQLEKEFNNGNSIAKDQKSKKIKQSIQNLYQDDENYEWGKSFQMNELNDYLTKEVLILSNRFRNIKY